MKLAALISGGKDSMLALHKAALQHEIVCLVGVIPENLHSYMFHTYNLHLLDAISSCLQLPIFKVPTAGVKEKEVEDLEKSLGILDVDGIVIGGIESEYQRNRFEKICTSLGLRMISPIWHEDASKLMEEVIEKFNTIIVSVSAMGLNESWLGRKLDKKALEDLKILNSKYGVHLAGEGGEYETLVLDAPLYKKKITVKEKRIRWRADSGWLEISSFELEEKKI
jgi:predicted ATP pyrophosphatase (TIGR00289 family)